MKFFLVLVLSIAISTFVTAQNSEGWITMPWNPSNSTLVNALNGGLEDAIPLAQAANQLAAGQWTLAQVTEVMELSQVDNVTDYAFEVNVTNGQDTAGLEMVVETTPDGETNQLIFWKVNS